MLSDIELKPCPFCGGQAEVVRVTDKYPNYVVNCRKCRISTAWYADVKQLSEFWNKRADEKHGINLTKINPVDEFICSECGFTTDECLRKIYDEDGDYFYHKECVFKYCPNCGAKMEEEK